MKTKLIMLFSFILKTFSAFTQNTSAEPIPTLLETAWEEREDVIYKSFFKNAPEQIYTPKDPSGIAIGGEALVLSRAGVIEIPPSEKQKYWTYITSGLSNPLDEKIKKMSGYGFELFIRVPEQSLWAIHLLFNLMGYVIETGKGFDKGHRMPLNGPINDDPNSQLNTLLFWTPENLPRTFKLKSGEVHLLELIGITETEYQYAKKHSSETLYRLLKKQLGSPLTDATRISCIGEDKKEK